MTAGYSGTPLPKKLGVRGRVLVAGAPGGFDLAVFAPPGEAPPHTRAGRDPYDVILAFCPDVAALRNRFEPLAGKLVSNGALWVLWPKKSSGVPTDLTENAVRDHGLAVGLVDVKVAAIDGTWSGLKFVYRLADRPR